MQQNIISNVKKLSESLFYCEKYKNSQIQLKA